MDTVNLNNSPVLTMEQITKQLFNNECFSDVQFLVEEKVIFAHSWELMKRSIVFQEQFRGNLGDNKLIMIADIKYDTFLEFVRFIYTDVCNMNNDAICEMLELARRYKVVKLETQLLNSSELSYDADLKLLEYCCINKYELMYNNVLDRVLFALNDIIDKDSFLKINSSTLEEILKSDRMHFKITEVKLFDALVRWMDKSCEINQMQRSERRSHFYGLLRHIRFPLMTTAEYYLCVKNHPDLFTSDDTSSICQTIILADQYKFTKWSTELRLNYSLPYELLSRSSISKWESKFTVSGHLILHGLRCGSGYGDFEIEITGQFRSINNTDIFRFNFEDSATEFNTVSLGESIKVEPNVDYKIEIKYRNDRSFIYSRKHNVNLIILGPADLVTFTEASRVLFEIFFKLPTN